MADPEAWADLQEVVAKGSFLQPIAGLALIPAPQRFHKEQLRHDSGCHSCPWWRLAPTRMAAQYATRRGKEVVRDPHGHTILHVAERLAAP